MAPPYFNVTSKKMAGSAAELACKDKHDHYTMIAASTFMFYNNKRALPAFLEHTQPLKISMKTIITQNTNMERMKCMGKSTSFQ